MSHAVIEPTDLDPIEIVPDHHNYIALVDENDDDDVPETSSLLKPAASIAMEIQSLPWYSRPSMWWIILPIFITATSFA